MRLFVSIDFPCEICTELYDRVPDIQGWRKTPASQIHLTLFFIGECPEALVEQISEELQTIRFQPFELVTSNLGAFPNQKKPCILWCGVEVNKALLDLQKAVEARLALYRKKPDDKPFFPHITLARLKRNSGKHNRVRELLSVEQTKLNVYIDRFSLKQSILKPGGSEHGVLKEFIAKGAS